MGDEAAIVGDEAAIATTADALSLLASYGVSTSMAYVSS